MSEPVAGPDAASLAKSLKEALTKFAAPLPGAGDDADAAPKPDEAQSAVSFARKKYDQILRWILGVFSAVALLIFASVPFTDLEDVDFWPGAGLGLLLAGAGLALVIWAAARGFEPQDASLGELHRTLAHVEPTAGKVRSVLRPRERAARDLYETLNGDEREAHLGPGITNVAELIERIGRLEQRIQVADVGWNGKGGPPRDGRFLNSATATAAIFTEGRSELERIAASLKELRAEYADATDEVKGHLGRLIGALETRYHTLLGLLPTVDQIMGGGELAALKATRDRYLEHRALLLDESAVSQLRGTYRLVWLWVLAGAALVLAGGILYAYTISNPTTDSAVQARITVDLKKGSDAWDAVKECRAGDVASDVVDLPALLVSSMDRDAEQDGPFTFVTTKAGCEGERVEVAQGDGSYDLPPATAAAEPTSTTPPPRPARLVAVTLKANMAPWLAARACRPSPRRSVDLRNLRALLRTATIADERRDGPFTIETADRRCRRSIVLTVQDGEGRYRGLGR